MDARLSDYVRGQWPSLVRYATLLCGDAVEAEELVQSALVRVALRWPFVRDKDDPSGYVKRAIVHANITRWRRIRSREISTEQLPERAVLVLRYLDDMTEQETAAVLGCSVGTVKSQAHKGLAKLREAYAADGVLQ